MLTYHGAIYPARDILIFADAAKHDIATRSEKTFYKKYPESTGLKYLLAKVGELLSIDPARMTPYFCGCPTGISGPLSQLKGDIGLMIPLVIPHATNWFTQDNYDYIFQANTLYSFKANMDYVVDVSDVTGCVILFISVEPL